MQLVTMCEIIAKTDKPQKKNKAVFITGYKSRLPDKQPTGRAVYHESNQWLLI
jgi:hypothetical protein